MRDHTKQLASGDHLPVVGLGTWTLIGESGRRAVRQALDLGYRHIDTATGYNNEGDVGHALRDSGIARESVFVTSKIPPELGHQAEETLAQSLRMLGVDYLDLWLIHSPPAADAEPEIWRAMEKALEAGFVRHIGVSNYRPAHLKRIKAAVGYAPSVNQISWNPTRHNPRQLAQLRGHGTTVVGYSPLRHVDLAHPVLTHIATAHHVTTAQVVLRWHLQHDIPVIPKSADPERQRANIDLFDFELTPDDMRVVDELSSLNSR